MKEVEALFGDLDQWKAIAAIPDDFPLKTSEAAIFMRESKSHLAARRTNGNGPDYYQNGLRKSGQERISSGPNQHIKYFKRDIIAFWNANKVSSSMEAAVRKGQTFATIFDLTAEEAYYVDAQGSVAGRVDDAPLSTVIERLGEWEIEWIPATEALARSWSDVAAHRAAEMQAQTILSKLASALREGLASSEVAAEVPAGAPQNPDKKPLATRGDIL